MAFALRRQLSDSSRKRNGGANIRRKNRRYLAAGLTVFSLLFGGLQVWAAEKPDAGWETKIQKEEKSNMEILIASEQPYTYLSQMKERIQFVGALSPGELYQLQEILPYLMIKEHIGKEEAAWDTKMYLEVVEEWKRREESPISEEEKQSLTEALIKMLPENGQSYVIDGKESRVDSLQRYGEFLQTQVSFSVEACLEKIRNSRTDDKEEPVEKEETLPDNVSKEQKAEGACRIGNTYYEDLSAALHAVKDNETIYIVQSHTMKDSFVYVEKTRTRKFQNVRILPEGGPRTVRMPDRHRLAFTKSSVAIGSKGSDPLTFDLSGTSVPDSDNLYCGAICANKGSSVTFENCVFQNGDQLSRWMIHGEYGSVTVDQCKFQNCDNGVGVVTEASSAFTPTEISFRVQNSVFDGIADIGAVHFSIHRANIRAEIQNNVFKNCRIGIGGIRSDEAPYTGPISARIQGNTFQNCYIGESFSQGTSVAASAFQVNVSNERYHGWQSTSQHPNVGDLYSGWFSTGFCNSNVEASVNGCSYENGVHGIATMSKGRTVVNNTTLARNNAKEANTEQCGQKGNGGGIFLNGGTIIWNSGTICENQADRGGAIYLKDGEILLKDGSFYGNRAQNRGGGIYNQSGTVKQEGGNFSANTAEIGSGVYQDGIYQMSGPALVDEGNDVYLPAEKYIEVMQKLQSVPAARVTPDRYENGRMVVKVSYGNRTGSMEWERFLLTPQSRYCLRPGDYQDWRAGTLKEAVTISSEYTVQYDKNTKAQVEQMPEPSVKYWYEKAAVSEQIPKWLDVPFLGWNENQTAKEGQYQPGENLPAEKNQDLTLYAIWEDRVSIRYLGNHAEEGQEKSEIVSYEDCLQNGYRIQKNKGYTDYKRNRHTFAGWDQRADVGAKEAAFQENRENRISYEELRKIAASQRTETGESREMAKVALYAIWDRAPEISAPDKEYFEGETVKKEDLLKDVQSTDREDGELTAQIKIVQIEYAPGRLTEDGKADKEVKTWKDGMSSEELLDTWFLQLDKKDSPVTHKVVYQVTDSIGNITEESCSVKIKYNEFPVIEAQDRYFTLQEAQQGAITEEVLKTQAISEGKVKANDTEEGDLSEKLKLLDFHPEEFQKFTDSGYIVLNWHVQDSMGPDGKGKETVRPFTVYVVKDGEILKAPHKQNVRFISEKYYRINENVDADALTEDEKEAYSKNGGLHVDSKWYQEQEYQDVIEKTWKKNGGKVYRFTHEDARRAEEFVDTHGIGNSRDENALAMFANEFLK